MQFFHHAFSMNFSKASWVHEFQIFCTKINYTQEVFEIPYIR